MAAMYHVLLEEVEFLGWFVDLEVDFNADRDGHNVEYEVVGLRMMKPEGEFIDLDWYLNDSVREELNNRLEEERIYMEEC